MRLVGFLGLLIATLPGVVFSPRHWRIAPWVTQIQQTGLNAVPIIALLTFLVGAVIPVGEGRRPADWPATVLAGRRREPAVQAMFDTLAQVGAPR